MVSPTWAPVQALMWPPSASVPLTTCPLFSLRPSLPLASSPSTSTRTTWTPTPPAATWGWVTQPEVLFAVRRLLGQVSLDSVSANNHLKSYWLSELERTILFYNKLTVGCLFLRISIFCCFTLLLDEAEILAAGTPATVHCKDFTNIQLNETDQRYWEYYNYSKSWTATSLRLKIISEKWCGSLCFASWLTDIRKIITTLSCRLYAVSVLLVTL